MKSFVFALVALFFGVATLSAQTPAKPAEAAKPAAAPADAGKDNAVTQINGPKLTPKPPQKPGSAYIPDEKGQGGTSLWDVLAKGKYVMIPLGIMSFLTVMFVLIFMATLRRSAILTSHYMNTADVLLKKRDYLGLLAISSRHGEAVARVVQRTLDFLTKNPSANFDVVKSVAESEGSAQAASLQHRVTYLADIGTLSPMVGLFGTVVGIIKSFGELASGPGVNRDWGLAGGVSEALIATGAGLVIGIVAFAFYAFFRNKVQRLISDLEVASSHVVGLMALNFNKKREASRAALDDEF